MPHARAAARWLTFSPTSRKSLNFTSGGVGGSKALRSGRAATGEDASVGPHGQEIRRLADWATTGTHTVNQSSGRASNSSRDHGQVLWMQLVRLVSALPRRDYCPLVGPRGQQRRAAIQDALGILNRWIHARARTRRRGRSTPSAELAASCVSSGAEAACRFSTSTVSTGGTAARGDRDSGGTGTSGGRLISYRLSRSAGDALGRQELRGG